jgi:ABC-type branched-subunit amino acid transport system substrate-binding protein
MRLLQHRKVGLAAGLSLAAAVTASAALAGSAAPQHATSGTITAGVLHAFTGPTAFFGRNASVACRAAASQINAAGGVLGQTLNCQNFDTQGDPADAVPVTNQMLATTSNLAMVVGPDGNDIPSVLPLITQSQVPEMNTVGDPRYDKQTSPYFWRLTPSDSTQGPAEAYYAVKLRNKKKIAAVFTNDLSAQTVVNPFKRKVKELGGTMAISLTLTPDQASYQTEVSKIIAAHPTAIVGDMDAQTAATLLSEVQQQNGGNLIPYIGGPQTIQGDWTSAVVAAVGGSAFQSSIAAVAPNLAGNKGAYASFQTAATNAGANGFQLHNAYVAATYDGVIAFALAMDAAKTTKGGYVSSIPKVTTAGTNSVVVHTYAQGLAAIKKHRMIDYIGAAGPLEFDKYHTAYRAWVSERYDSSSQAWNPGAVIPKKDTLP